MGYKAPRTVLRLQFTSPKMRGLEVDVNPVSPRQFQTIGKLSHMAELKPGDIPSVEMIDGFVELCDKFGEALSSWNLEDDDGNPIPATPEGLGRQEIPFVMAIVLTWLEAVAGYAQKLVSQAEQNGAGDRSANEAGLGLPVEALAPVTGAVGDSGLDDEVQGG